MDLHHFYGLVRGPQLEKLTVSGIPNRINCVFLIVFAQFTNVAAGRIIQPGGLRFDDPGCRGYSLILVHCLALNTSCFHKRVSNLLCSVSTELSF